MKYTSFEADTLFGKFRVYVLNKGKMFALTDKEQRETAYSALFSVAGKGARLEVEGKKHRSLPKNAEAVREYNGCAWMAKVEAKSKASTAKREPNKFYVIKTQAYTGRRSWIGEFDTSAEADAFIKKVSELPQCARDTVRIVRKAAFAKWWDAEVKPYIGPFYTYSDATASLNHYRQYA